MTEKPKKPERQVKVMMEDLLKGQAALAIFAEDIVTRLGCKWAEPDNLAKAKQEESMTPIEELFFQGKRLDLGQVHLSELLNLIREEIIQL